MNWVSEVNWDVWQATVSCTPWMWGLEVLSADRAAAAVKQGCGDGVSTCGGLHGYPNPYGRGMAKWLQRACISPVPACACGDPCVVVGDMAAGLT